MNGGQNPTNGKGWYIVGGEKSTNVAFLFFDMMLEHVVIHCLA